MPIHPHLRAPLLTALLATHVLGEPATPPPPTTTAQPTHTTGAATPPPPTPEAGEASEAPSKPRKPRFLELSVHGSEKLPALVAWQQPGPKEAPEKQKITVTKIARPFSFEWLEIPEKAVAFQVLPDLAPKDIDPKEWIPLNIPAEHPDNAHLYVSLRKSSGTSFDAITKSSLEEKPSSDAPRKFKKLRYYTPFAPTSPAWVYVGNWNPDSKSWRSVYWLMSGPSSKFSDRQVITAQPADLRKDAPIIRPDFPMVPRQEPSSKAPVLGNGNLLRPGTNVVLNEVTFSISGSYVAVWAKVTAQANPTTE